MPGHDSPNPPTPQTKVRRTNVLIGLSAALVAFVAIFTYCCWRGEDVGHDLKFPAEPGSDDPDTHMRPLRPLKGGIWP